MGRQKNRGELDRAVIAGLRFDDYMHLLLKEILHHNNNEYIDPTRLEMYSGLKERTRRGVVEWLMEHHYMSSSAMDIDVLRVACLPRFEASMHGDGIHIFMPGSQGKSLIKKLVYRSDYLLTSGMLHQSNRKVHKLEVHMNPMDLTHIWSNIDGLKRFEYAGGDQDLAGVTLIDWLAITEDDKLAAYLSGKQEVQHLADKLATSDHLYKAGRKDRQAAIKAHGKLTKKEMKSDVRLMTQMEKALLTGMPVKEDAYKGANTSDYFEKKASLFEPAAQGAAGTSDDFLIAIAARVYEKKKGTANG